MKQRLIAFDIAKAVCIIFVVVGHYSPEGMPGWYTSLRSVIYAFHMPLFMFASGYIYNATRKDETYGAFLLKKVRRLMVPYLTTSVIVITLKLLALGNAYVENPVTWWSYVEILWSPSAGYFLWFIWALWWMFVIAPLFKSVKGRIGLLTVALFLALLPVELSKMFCLEQFRGMLLYFALGMVCSDYRHRISFSKYRAVGVTLFISFYILMCYNTMGGGRLAHTRGMLWHTYDDANSYMA